MGCPESKCAESIIDDSMLSHGRNDLRRAMLTRRTLMPLFEHFRLDDIDITLNSMMRRTLKKGTTLCLAGIRPFIIMEHFLKLTQCR